MRTKVHDVLPISLRRSLLALGVGINVARRKRRFTVASMAERLAISMGTYRRIERGDPTVAMGTYAMALFVLDLRNLEQIVAPANDELGLMLDQERLPKRVRHRLSEASP